MCNEILERFENVDDNKKFSKTRNQIRHIAEAFSVRMFKKIFGSGATFRYECRIVGLDPDYVETISHNGYKNITFNLKNGDKFIVHNSNKRRKNV